MLDDWVGLVVVGGYGYGVNATDGGSVHIYIYTDVRGRDRGQGPVVWGQGYLGTYGERGR